MAKNRRHDNPRLDETMGRAVGNEPQPSNTLPEAVVGQTEQPGRDAGQLDESGMGSSAGVAKGEDGEPIGGTLPEHSGKQVGHARNGRGAQREARESIVERDRDADRDSNRGQRHRIRRETDFRDATAHPLDPDAGGPKVTREDDLFGREGESS